MRSSIKISAFFAILLLASLLGCKQVATQKADEKSPEEVQWSKLTFLADSSWQVMMGSDDSKISNLKRLVNELELIKGSDPSRLSKLKSEIDQLSTVRYSRKSMGMSSVIDRYDSATNAVLSSVREEVQTNPEAERFQIVQQLRSEIQMADDSVLHFRKEYDKQIDALNGFLKKNRKQLKRINPIFDTIQPFPVFRLKV